jgi:hypothetical protein
MRRGQQRLSQAVKLDYGLWIDLSPGEKSAEREISLKY